MSADGNQGPARRAAAAARETNRRPGVMRAVRTARALLPGDPPLGEWPGAEDETASRELALAGLQVWQALSGRLGRGADAVDATLLFTELCDFSTWVHEAGDERALELLRSVAAVVEPAITSRRGRVVKRLRAGHMAVFAAAADGVQAALDAQEQLAGLDADGDGPRLRAGLHCGRPRQVGGDFLGVDVNTAARITESARPGEVLISGEVAAALEPDGRQLSLKRRRRFRAKGTPSGLEVFCVTRA